MATRTNYNAEAVEAARSVLIELTHLLGEYRDDIVLIGGWVPDLLLRDGEMPHVGSMDIDLALNHLALSESGYQQIGELLASRGYRQSEQQPFIFLRDVPVGARTITVQVDLLAGEYGGTGKRRRTQRVQDVQPRKVRGCDLALGMATEITVSGTLPGGGRDTVVVRVAGIVPFIVMKGMALHDRLKEKDAWDIYYCLRNYPGGLDALIQAFRPHVGLGLVNEGLVKIAAKFSSPDDVAPRFVADFDEILDPEDRALRQRDAYERVQYLLGGLGVV